MTIDLYLLQQFRVTNFYMSQKIKNSNMAANWFAFSKMAGKQGHFASFFTKKLINIGHFFSYVYIRVAFIQIA